MEPRLRTRGSTFTSGRNRWMARGRSFGMCRLPTFRRGDSTGYHQITSAQGSHVGVVKLENELPNTRLTHLIEVARRGRCTYLGHSLSQTRRSGVVHREV